VTPFRGTERSGKLLTCFVDYRPGDVTPADEVTCTKCQRSFSSRSSLHCHIVECGDFWRNLSDRLTWVFVLRGWQIPVPPPTSLSSTSSSAKNKKKRRGKYRWGTISTSGDALRRRLQRMLMRQHVGIAVGQHELGALPVSKTTAGVLTGGASIISRVAHPQEYHRDVTVIHCCRSIKVH
jgi:hypothetical protein